jgi:signal transduction protein with GAF and PtsI domain
MTQVLTQLRVDATAVYLFDRFTQTLEYAAGRGFHTHATESLRFRLGEGMTGRAVLDNKIVSIPDLANKPDLIAKNPFLETEGFVSYFAAPLFQGNQGASKY